jgi:hypothetical protein
LGYGLAGSVYAFDHSRDISSPGAGNGLFLPENIFTGQRTADFCFQRFFVVLRVKSSAQEEAGFEVFDGQRRVELGWVRWLVFMLQDN